MAGKERKLDFKAPVGKAFEEHTEGLSVLVTVHSVESSGCASGCCSARG